MLKTVVEIKTMLIQDCISVVREHLANGYSIKWSESIADGYAKYILIDNVFRIGGSYAEFAGVSCLEVLMYPHTSVFPAVVLTCNPKFDYLVEFTLDDFEKNLDFKMASRILEQFN